MKEQLRLAPPPPMEDAKRTLLLLFKYKQTITVATGNEAACLEGASPPSRWCKRRSGGPTTHWLPGLEAHPVITSLHKPSV